MLSCFANFHISCVKLSHFLLDKIFELKMTPLVPLCHAPRNEIVTVCSMQVDMNDDTFF